MKVKKKRIKYRHVVFGIFIGVIITGSLCFKRMHAIQNVNDFILNQNSTMEKEITNMKQLIQIQKAMPLTLTYYTEPNEDTDIRHIITTREQLDAFLIKNHLSHIVSSAFLYRLGAEYDIDPGFALAMAMLETGRGSSEAFISSNNPAGIRCGETYCAYRTREEGFEAEIKLLHYYAEEEDEKIHSIRNTPKLVRQKWSEIGIGTEETVAIWQEILGIHNKK